jgi:tRNA G37 N-methylase Trm5
MFKPEDVVADVFAGVGPFVVPAAKKGCAALGNDLNPISVKYLLQNVKDNKVGLSIQLLLSECAHGVLRRLTNWYECYARMDEISFEAVWHGYTTNPSLRTLVQSRVKRRKRGNGEDCRSSRRMTNLL